MVPRTTRARRMWPPHRQEPYQPDAARSPHDARLPGAVLASALTKTAPGRCPMIQVTERAREALKAVQTQMADKPEVALRLAQVEQGQLGVFPDTGRHDDHVGAHEG